MTDQDQEPFAYIRSGDLPALEKWLDAGGDIEIRGRFGDTLLAIACLKGKREAVEMLLKRGADVNAEQGSGGDSVLGSTCNAQREETEIVKILLRNGANVDHRCESGHTPLINAASHDYRAIASVLIQHGADVNAVSVNDETALSFAIVWEYTELAKDLINAGTDIKWETNGGWTYLKRAAFELNHELEQLLLEKGADPKDLDIPMKMSPESVAAEREFKAEMRREMEREAGKDSRDSSQ